MQCIQLVRATQQFTFPSLPLPQPGKVLVQHEQAREISRIAHLSSRHGRWTYQSQCRRRVGEKVLAVLTAAQVSSSVSFLFYPVPQEGREVICMHVEDLSSNLKEERDVAFTERNSVDAKKHSKKPEWYQDPKSRDSHVPLMNVKAPRILGIRHAPTHHLELLLTVTELWMPYTNESLL